MTNLLQPFRDLLQSKPREQSPEQSEDVDEPRTRSRGFVITCVLIAVVIGLSVIWFLPQWKIDHALDAKLSLDKARQLELQDAFRKTISQIVLSLSGLLILYFTWRRAEAGDKTVRIMEQGHITDRFTKAIEQLGKTDGDKPNIEVRLGAIYALERIAIDSPRDHWTIMEVLTAYVRQNAPLDPERPYTEGEKPRTDIQAILTVLGRRRIGPKRERPGQQLDLSNSRLCGASLFQAKLREVFLFQTNLQKANLWESNLQKACLWKANLQEADLVGANLQCAYLLEANLKSADLTNVNLQEANLTGGRLDAVNLGGANLQEANLNAANLQGAFLGGANLKAAFLPQADLQNADLMRANLQEANLKQANLQTALLQFANLHGATLRGAVLQGADLGNVKLQEADGLTVEQIQSTINWRTAHYSPAFRAKLDFPPDPNSN